MAESSSPPSCRAPQYPNICHMLYTPTRAYAMPAPINMCFAAFCKRLLAIDEKRETRPCTIGPLMPPAGDQNQEEDSMAGNGMSPQPRSWITPSRCSFGCGCRARASLHLPTMHADVAPSGHVDDGRMAAHPAIEDGRAVLTNEPPRTPKASECTPHRLLLS